MRIYLNPCCDYGKGWRKWQKIEPILRHRFGGFEVEEIISPVKLSNQIKKAIDAGERIFIAAGGDGTVNLMVNSLMKSTANKKEIFLGALGLGSSNDFHKPFRPETFTEGIPTRMDWQKAVPYDLIRVRYGNERGQIFTRHCIINASIGITAQANAYYNSRHSFLEFIQRVSIEAAIVVSALKTISAFKNIPCSLTLGEFKRQPFSLTNLGVIKNPHFAGGLCYDTLIGPGTGILGVNLCSDMTKLEAVRALVRLYKHQFQGFPKTHSWFATKLSVSSALHFSLEMDGEVVSARHVEFELVPKAVRCCQ